MPSANIRVLSYVFYLILQKTQYNSLDKNPMMGAFKMKLLLIVTAETVPTKPSSWCFCIHAR